MVICKNCGQDAGDSKFCPNCGTEIVVEEVSSICPSCGFDAGDSKFCPNCGSKIVVEEVSSICPSCGFDAGDSKFCPECGTKIGVIESHEIKCPNCGKTLNKGGKFCPYCGWSESQDNSNSSLDKLIDVDNKVSDRFSNRLGKSRSMNKVLDKTASLGYKHSVGKGVSSVDRAYFEKIEPVFLEVLDSIDDDFVKSVLLYQRSMMGTGGSVVGVVAAQVYTPTKDMPHDEAIKFYQNMVNDIVSDINLEKQKGTFNEEEYYKKIVKEATLDNISVIGIPKSVKSWKNNRK